MTNAHFIRVLFFFHSFCSLHCVPPRTTKIGGVGRSGNFRILETFGQDIFFSRIIQSNLKLEDLTESYSDFIALTSKGRAEVFGNSYAAENMSKTDNFSTLI